MIQYLLVRAALVLLLGFLLSGCATFAPYFNASEFNCSEQPATHSCHLGNPALK